MMAGGDNDFGTPWKMRDSQALVDAKDAKEFCELISFENATVVPGIVNDTWFAIVTGVARCSNMAVQLAPLIYVQKPDYWDIQVIGCVGEICLEALRPYSVWLDVTNFRGHKGINIVGSNKNETISIP